LPERAALPHDRLAIFFVVRRRIVERNHPIGVATHDVGARFFQAAQNLTRARTIHAQIAGRNDAIGTTGCGKIR
jgi:hypothetical protein